MNYKSISNYIPVIRSGFVKNSFWGLVSKILQTLFLSLFFVIVSRHYSTIEFANYLVATSIYQFMVGISSMGLGTWFIRELGYNNDNKAGQISRFIKIQIGLGVFFYLVNICLVFILYPAGEGEIRLLGLILGTNIIFDNIIYALSSLNIAEFKQKKTAMIMALDAFARLLIVCLLFLSSFSIISLSLLLVLVRLFTVNMFIRIGTTSDIGIKYLWRFKVSLSDIKKQILPNWRFAIIVGLYIIFWRSATVIISKFLTMNDVANYEISYKVFSMFNILPLIILTTFYPKLVKFYANNDYKSIRKFYNLFFFVFGMFSLISYAFIQSFADLIIPFVFGNNYAQGAKCLKEMFLTFLFFPTLSLQANLILAMKLERMDMYFNMMALAIFFTGCIVGLYFYHTLSVINYSILAAFVVFHISQSVLLNNLKVNSLTTIFKFYSIVIIFVLTYQFALNRVNPAILFLTFIGFVVIPLTLYFVRSKKIYFQSFPKPSVTFGNGQNVKDSVGI